MNYPKTRYTGEKPWMNKEWLYDQYVVKDRSSQEIADEYGCKRNTVQQWLAKHKISKDNVKRVYKLKPYNTYDYLYYHHVVLDKSIREIASENGVSYDTIRSNLVTNGIKINKRNTHKKYSEAEIDNMVKLYCEDRLSTNKIAEIYSTNHGLVKRYLQSRGIKTRNMVEAQFCALGKEIPQDLLDPEILSRLHWDEGMSCKEIGQIYDVDAGTIRRQMHRLGLRTKSNSEAKIGVMTGESHPNWQGGKTPLKQLLREFFNVNQAPVIAKRDNYTCQMCGATHTVLHVHHIIRFAVIVDNICDEHPELNPDNEVDRQKLYDIITHDSRFLDENNLITYCASCHLFKVHKFTRRKTISSQAS